MKKFIIASLMLASLNAFSQSYIILSNGITLTTDKSGFIYDFGHFRIPYKITVNGGNFFVADEKLSTVDASGMLYQKDMEVKKIKGKGLNYFISNKNYLITIDEAGFVYEYDDSGLFKKALNFGGNFFTVKGEKKATDLYTVSSKGNYFKMEIPGLNPADIVKFGGSFFQTKQGMIYTVSKDGLVYSKPESGVGEVKKMGGNYLIDSKDFLYTVSEEGLLALPILPTNIVVNDLIKLGSNYMLDSQGRIFVVDHMGMMFERTPEHDLTKSKIIAK